MKQRERRYTLYFTALLILPAGLLSVLFLVAGAGCNGGNGVGGIGGMSLSDRLDAAQSIQDPVERCNKFLEIADWCIDGGDLGVGAKNSLNMANKAADDISAKKNADERAAAYIALAHRWRRFGDLGECEDAYEEAEDAVKKIEDPADKTNRMIDIARLKIKLEENDDAVKDLKAAEAELERISGAQERVGLLAWIAYAHVEMKDKDEAKRVMGVAIHLAETEEKASEKSRLYALIGKEQIQSLDENETGMATIKQALEVAHTIEDNPNLLANILIDIAETYKTLEVYDKARSLLREAEELCQGRSECKPALRRIEDLRKEI